MTSAPLPRPSSRASRSTTVRKLLGAVAGMLFVVALTAVLVECMYRYYLSSIVAEEVAKIFKPVERPSFEARGIAPWIFDRELGFVFEQRPWRAAIIRDGAFDQCHADGQGNRYGNFGRAPDNYDQADFRLMIVGSSYSMVGDKQGHLVDQVLMDRLSSRLGRTVSVLNFSRDATGVLTYIDTARYKVDELKPHAIVALINVSALIYQRHWRVVLPEDDGFRRMYFSLDPVARPTDPTRAVPQAIVISDKITEEWCRQMTDARSRGDGGAARNDPLVQKLIARHRKLQHETVVPQILIDFWRSDVSYVLNLLLTGDPFNGMSMFGDQPIYTPLALDRYSDDPDFNAAVKHLKESGVPFIPVHIPTLPEMRKYPDGGYEFASHAVPPRRGARLVADLEQALGEPFVHLYRYYPTELKAEPLQLVLSANDWHPNHTGVHAMAEALERMLLQHPRTAHLFKRAD